LNEALNYLAVKASQKFNISIDVIMLIYGLFVIIWAPIGEELFYRGYIYGDLREKYSFWFSTIISTVFFSIRHMTHFLFLLPLYPTFAASFWAIHTFIFEMFMCYIYEKTENLYSVMITHFLYNLLDILI